LLGDDQKIVCRSLQGAGWESGPWPLALARRLVAGVASAPPHGGGLDR
jgi:hypothetical protein